MAFLLGLAVGSVPEFEGFPISLLLLALACSISLAAGMAAQKGTAGFWLVNIHLAANLAFCLAILGIALAGAGIILAAVETLLGIETGEIFEFLLIVASGFAAPLLWLSLTRFCETEMVEEEQSNLLHRVIAVVTDGLLIPLMLVFGTVIHVYAAQIAILAELPTGQIGWVASVYLIVGYGVFLLAHGPEALLPRLRNLFRRMWLPGTLVPVALLALATAIRVEAFGFTEDRYLLILIIAAAALFAASVLIRRPFDIRLAPLVVGVLALVAAIGPLNAKKVSIRSQTARAYAILASVPPERWAMAKDGGLSERQKEDLVSAIQYLLRAAPELKMLSPVWPPHLPREGWRLELALALSGSGKAELETTSFHFSTGDVIRLDAVTLIEPFTLNWENASRTIASGSLQFRMQRVQENILEASDEESTTRFDLSPLLTMEKSGDQQPPPVLRSVEGRKGDLIVLSFIREQEPEGPVLKSVSAKMVLY